ncbi:MAG: rRNA maturation RNase YbeY [Bacteroidales bacterium]|nr:rRNA maturation RNase YbeY [Bacteroidales bacterium]
MSIRIYYDQINYRINKAREIRRFLEKVIRDEHKIPGDLVFIITDDETILTINREFLKHDYYTDVIAFDKSESGLVSGEVFISIDTVRKNARQYKCRLQEEVVRVMIHGVLHLCGYRDGSAEERKKMIKVQEDKLAQIREAIL